VSHFKVSGRPSTRLVNLMPDDLIAEARTLQSLDEAMRWGLNHDPRITPEDVVVQDEYTHDVLFRTADNTYLVFDTS
jgi:hypothetical protein